MFSIHRFLSIDFTISLSLKNFFAPTKNKRRVKDKIELKQNKAIVSLPSEFTFNKFYFYFERIVPEFLKFAKLKTNS